MNRLILPVLMLVMAGCDSGLSPEIHPARHTGTYVLSTVNGAKLPFIVDELMNDRVEVIAGSIDLNADGTFTDRATFRETRAGEVTTHESATTGTYSREVSIVNFRSGDQGGTYRASISGTALVIIAEGLRGVYRRAS